MFERIADFLFDRIVGWPMNMERRSRSPLARLAWFAFSFIWFFPAALVVIIPAIVCMVLAEAVESWNGHS